MVSKALVPPWNDSSKNLAKDVVVGTNQVDFTVFTDGSFAFECDHVCERPIYGKKGRFAPSIRQNSRVVRALLSSRLPRLHHYFFAPNNRTARVLRGIRRLRRSATIHTICSVPKTFENINQALFADVHVALSRHSCERLKEQNVRGVHWIPPCIPRLDPVFSDSKIASARRKFGLSDHAPIVLFPGDYDFGNTAQTVAQAAIQMANGPLDVQWVFACRLKTPHSQHLEHEIRQRLRALIDGDRVIFFNQVDDMHSLIIASDLVVLPADTTYAKMDLPLVLLESMSLGRPILVSRIPPLDELTDDDVAYSVDPLNAPMLADCIGAALEDESGRAERVRRGTLMATSRFDRTKVAQEYVRLYKELAGQ